MIFATPIAALGFTTTAALAAVYCFRRKSPERKVGSLLLWPRPRPASTRARRRDRPVLPPIFWLELFVLVALVAAALTPLAWRRSAGTLHVVLDASPSMSAGGGEAARLAEEALDREMRRGMKDTVRVRRAANSRELAREVAAAKSASMPGDEILVLTDVPPPEGTPRAGLRWEAFGKPLSNFAITSARRLRASPGVDSVFVEVRRFGPGADETTLTLSGHGTAALRLGKEGRAWFSTSVPASDGTIVASIPPDALAADNEIALDPPDVPRVAAAVSFRNKPRSDLARRALDATGFVTNFVPVADADVVLADHAVQLAPHQYLVQFHESSAARTAGPVWADPAEPLLYGVALDGDPYAISTDALPGAPAAFLGTAPLVSVESNACHLAFSNPQLPFFRSPAFPALVQNAVAAAYRRLAAFRREPSPKPQPAAPLDADESDLTGRATARCGSRANAPEIALRTKSVAWIPAVLALLALAVHFKFTRSRAAVAVAALAAFALLRPGFPKSDRAGRLVVLADRSRSMPDAAIAEQARMLRGISAARPEGAELAVVAFGRTAEVETRPGAEGFSEFIQDVDRDGSDVALALEKSAAFVEDGRPTRILLLSDGLFTSPPGDAPASVDTFSQSRPFAHDLSVESVDAPDSVAPGAPVPVTAWAAAPETTTNAYALLRGTNVVARGTKVFRQGLTPLVFRDFAGRAGLRRYALEIKPSGDDPCPENNRADFLVKVEGRRPLLYLHEGNESSVPDTIRRGGVPVEARDVAELRGGIAALEDYGGVLLDNVPAKSFSPPFLRALAAYAVDLGRGLALAGGERSFGPGGWYKTPVEDVLPVSLELRQEHRKFSVALAIVMDRSGSMAASAGGGRTKMDMANLGAMAAIDMLSSMDEVAVVAVDSQPHLVLEMQYADLAQSRRGSVLGIRSMGGGIFVEEGVMAGLRQLERASSPTRHLVLFADAADSEEPGDYKSYLAKAAAAGVTVSVIGLGSESDCDAALLKDIAAAAGGTCQFESDANEIPRLFMQDTYLVAKSAMCTNVTPVRATGALRQISDALGGDLAAVGGYNLAYIRDGAEAAILTEDDERAPVLAFRRAGAGRTLAFTGELAGPHSAPLMTSKDGAELATAIARWTLGDEGTERDGFLFERRVEPGGVRITAAADDEGRLAALPNSGLRLVTLLDRGDGGVERREDALRRESSGTLAAFVPLHGGETAFPVVVLPGGKQVPLAPARLPHPAEFHRPSDPSSGERALARLSERSGGRARTSLDGIWDEIPPVRRFVPLAPWLYLLSASAFLAAVFVRRLGMRGTWHLKLPRGARREQATGKPRAAGAPGGPAAPREAEPKANATFAALAAAKRRAAGNVR